MRDRPRIKTRFSRVSVSYPHQLSMTLDCLGELATHYIEDVYDKDVTNELQGNDNEEANTGWGFKGTMMSWHMAYTDIPVFIVIAPHAAGDDNQPDQLWMEIMQNQAANWLLQYVSIRLDEWARHQIDRVLWVVDTNRDVLDKALARMEHGYWFLLMLLLDKKTSNLMKSLSQNNKFNETIPVITSLLVIIRNAADAADTPVNTKPRMISNLWRRGMAAANATAKAAANATANAAAQSSDASASECVVIKYAADMDTHIKCNPRCTAEYFDKLVMQCSTLNTAELNYDIDSDAGIDSDADIADIASVSASAAEQVMAAISAKVFCRMMQDGKAYLETYARQLRQCDRDQAESLPARGAYLEMSGTRRMRLSEAAAFIASAWFRVYYTDRSIIKELRVCKDGTCAFLRADECEWQTERAIAAPAEVRAVMVVGKVKGIVRFVPGNTMRPQVLTVQQFLA
eukprot:gene17708-24066_t